MNKLPPKWEAIIDGFTVGCAEHVYERVAEAVAACYALHSAPPKELTEAELDQIVQNSSGLSYTQFGRKVEIAAHRKQREPQVVKFRAARFKKNGQVDMLRVGFDLDEAAWEWLEPAQEIEVVLK